MTVRSRMLLRLGCFLAVGWGMGCAETGVAERHNSGDPTEVARALATAVPPRPGPVNATGRPFVYLVVDQPGTTGANLVAFDLGRNQVAWRQPANVAMRLAVGRNVLVHSETQGTLVGHDTATGAVLWHQEAEPGLVLVGYAVDQDDVYVLYRNPRANGRDRGGQLVAIEGRRGTIRFRRPLPANVGAPAAWGGLVAVPNQSQFVTLFDGQRGGYLGEFLAREEAASFVEAQSEGLFFGSRGVFWASPQASFGARTPGAYLQARLPDFVHPNYHPDGYKPEQGAYTALDRNRVLWRASIKDGRAAFLDAQVVVHSFRFFFAMNASTGSLSWAYQHPREDVVASAHAGSAILFATADGQVGALGIHDGRRLFLVNAVGGSPGIVRGAAFDADGIAQAGPGGQNAASPLDGTLTSIVLDPDKRFGEIKLFALTELASLPDANVTADLVKILEQAPDEGALPERATDLLVSRKDPAAMALYVASVRQRADFAEGGNAPRLDVLARAMKSLNAKAAIPDLVEHLRLPETDPSDVADIAAVAVAMGAREAVEPFRDYLAQYRCDPAFVGAPGALLAAADLLLKLGGLTDRAYLLFIAQDERSVPALRASIRQALAETSALGHSASQAVP